MLVGVQQTAERAAEAEDGRLDKNNAHDSRRQELLFGRKVGHEHVRRQPRGQQDADGRHYAQNQQYKCQNGVGQTSAGVAPFARQVLAVDRDEGRGQRAAGDDGEEQFG